MPNTALAENKKKHENQPGDPNAGTRRALRSKREQKIKCSKVTRQARCKRIQGFAIK